MKEKIFLPTDMMICWMHFHKKNNPHYGGLLIKNKIKKFEGDGGDHISFFNYFYKNQLEIIALL